MLAYTKLHGFENVFDSDECVDVGADASDKESLMAQGVSGSMYEKQLMAWVSISPVSYTHLTLPTILLV